MEFIDGTVENIVFRNEDNGYTVMEIDADGILETAVGNMPMVYEGERVKLSGTWTRHKSYGNQFKAETCTKLPPKGEDGVLRYLSSGIIKGIGPATAKKIVGTFGEDTIETIRSNPKKLLEVEGIGKSKATVIAKALSEHIAMQDNMIFLQGLSVPMGISAKICNHYGIPTQHIVENNPYRLANDIDGIGFLRADKIASALNYDTNSPARITAGIKYILNETAKRDGNTCLPLDMLKERAIALLGCSDTSYETAINDLKKSREIVIRIFQDTEMGYLEFYDKAERYTASKLSILAKSPKPQIDINDTNDMITSMHGIKLSKEQLNAVEASLSSNISIITGGPGTGKTTIVKCIINAIEQVEDKVILAAPTGRAAKRLSQTTNHESSTIHRLLEYGYSEDDENISFSKDEYNQIDCDTLIIDEMSMVDIVLMHHLLKAVPLDCRLIMVGDSDQLPSVGPGNLLHDLISSDYINVCKLTKIYRQAQESLIVMNAHSINSGNMPVLNDRKSDFFFIDALNGETVINNVISLAKERIPKYLDCDSLKDIQILSPAKRGDLGIINLNEVLQNIFNPANKMVKEKTYGSHTFRVGDKIMQIKNNYKIEWKTTNPNGTTSRGTGVFNGDTGFIDDINLIEEILHIEFDDGKRVDYPFSNLDELQLAYAMTVHKSQGSEYKVVILPLLGGNPILYSRNLLYTAITRAKQMVIIVGSQRAVKQMVDNNHTYKRYSCLSEHLKLQL